MLERRLLLLVDDYYETIFVHDFFDLSILTHNYLY